MCTNDPPKAPQSVEPHLPSDLDRGLAFAYGEGPPPEGSPSVIERLKGLADSRVKVFLRDEVRAGDTPMLKPLGPGEARQAGKYVVHGELGRGGVGAVHKGHDQDLGRDVAMKFLHDKYRDHPDILHRFVEEAQIGGQLQHPGIVPVYDLGLAGGRPFFAMKLVKGQTLAKKLAERGSPSEDRRSFVAIFEDVCQTMAYAHARGVVHRDLKPANVMIGSFGEVQVVDWGMGKVLASGGLADEKLAEERQEERSVIATVRSSGHGSQSLVGSVMGTPAYMPPEQARGEVADMDERSDVFALGAILCEVLTGRPPYVGNRDELIGMVAEAKLDAAYQRLAACGAEPELAELAKACLAPSPAARPRSAEVVAQRVHDHLAAAEERVHAARVEAAEAKVRAAALKRTQALGIGLTVVIAAGLVVSLWFWRAASEAAGKEKLARDAAVAAAGEAQRNAELAKEQTERAERELARAVEIKRLIFDMLEKVRPEAAASQDTALLTGILDSTAERLVAGAIEDELVAAELHGVVGRTYGALGQYAKAERHLPIAAEVLTRRRGSEHEDSLGANFHLALLYHLQGRDDEAEPLMRETAELAARTLGEEHPDTLVYDSELGAILDSQGRVAEAEALYARTLETQERVLGEDDPGTPEGMSRLGLVYLNQQRFAEAEALFTRALELVEQVHGEEHVNTLRYMGNLALAYCAEGRLDEAERLLRRVLEPLDRVVPGDHPMQYRNRINLGRVYLDQGRFAEAEPLLVYGIALEERVLGERHVDTLIDQYHLFRLYEGTGRAEDAEDLMWRTLELQREELGDENPDTLSTLTNLGLYYLRGGRFEEAEPLFVEALAGRRSVFGEDNVSTSAAYANLGLLYNSMGRLQEAAPLFEAGLPVQRRLLGVKHPWTGMTLSGLATAYEGTGRTDEALALRRELLDVQLSRVDEEGADAASLNQAAWVLLTVDEERLRDPERALGYAQRACELGEEAGAPMLWGYLDSLALAQHRTGDSAAAVETQRRAMELMPAGADPTVAERLAEYEAAAKGR